MGLIVHGSGLLRAEARKEALTCAAAGSAQPQEAAGSSLGVALGHYLGVAPSRASAAHSCPEKEPVPQRLGSRHGRRCCLAPSTRFHPSHRYAAAEGAAARRKLPFAVDRDPTFGPLGTSPVVREASLTTTDFLAFAASGAACTSLVRIAVEGKQTLAPGMHKRSPEPDSLWLRACS